MNTVKPYFINSQMLHEHILTLKDKELVDSLSSFFVYHRCVCEKFPVIEVRDATTLYLIGKGIITQ